MGQNWRVKSPRPEFTRVQVAHLVLKALAQMHLRQPHHALITAPTSLHQHCPCRPCFIISTALWNTAWAFTGIHRWPLPQASNCNILLPSWTADTESVIVGQGVSFGQLDWDEKPWDLYSIHSSALELLHDVEKFDFPVPQLSLPSWVRSIHHPSC